ncbi:MAG: tetratricopeptide repeat protein [Nitrospiraceae bacterium]|nr:MAG: tetratricopeptide repeat protein [Nitrospiraceae bacterium]
MKNNNRCLRTLQFLAFTVLLVCIPLITFSSEKFYTVAISSFKNAAPAEKQFDVIAQKLNITNLDYLRVEKIGKFYSVRIGKFSDSKAANKLLRTVKPVLPRAIVLHTGVIDERIVKMYTHSIPDPQTKKNKPYSTSESARNKQRVTSKNKNMVPGISSKDSLEVAGSPADNSGNTRVVKDTLTISLDRVAGYIDDGDYAYALKMLESEIDDHPEDPELNAWLGTVLIKMEKPLKALSHMEKAVKLTPDRADYHNAIGYSLLLSNRFGEAVSSFQQAIDLDPQFVDAIAGLCIAHVKGGNKIKAMSVYNNLKDRDKRISDQLLTLIEK